MPFDEGHLLRGALDYLANRSAVGTVMMHPIWFTLVLVAVIVLVLIVCWDGSVTFKLVFYLLVGVGCSVLAHDALVEQHHIEKHGTSAMIDMVEDMQNRGEDEEIHPRTLEEMPDQLVADQRSAFIQPLNADEVEAMVDRT
jgi:hypothetical protein